ncbi:hypothetical protein HanIR_Chr13g0632001 [Helianthus annuus]|nr:hypothetical protein HanIR_Chr13g0632001 [Helianthus annuus]
MVINVTTSVPDRVVCERVVNVEEFRKIGIVQMFERQGWERVLDWCEDNTSRVYLAEVCEWLASLRFMNKDGPPAQWRLVGKTSRVEMTMSFETINCIVRFDSLEVQVYDYPTIEQFLDNHANGDDPEQMTAAILPYNDGGAAQRTQMTVEGRILQGIFLENVLVRFGDRGGVRASDCRVVHSLLYGTPTLSWRHTIMMNTWFTRESFHWRMIPYMRLISAMILQQNCLPTESLWVSKPLEEFSFATIKKNWKIHVKLSGSKYVVTDKLGHSYEFVDPDMQREDDEDVERVDEEDKTEPPGPRGPKQRYMRPHRELNAEVASFVNFRRVPSYKDFNRGQQEVFDNVSAGIGEGREYDKRRQNWEETHGSQMQEQWAFQVAYRERMEKHTEEQQMQQALQRSQMELLIKMQQDETARRRAWEVDEERR